MTTLPDPVTPVGRPPDGTLRRALADAFHAANHEQWETCDIDCGGRLTRHQLVALDVAARDWSTQQVDRAVANERRRARTRS